MTWTKGESGNKLGRPKRNEIEKQNIAHFKEQLKKYSVTALDELVELMQTSMNQEIRFKCCTYILDKYLGKNFAVEEEEQKQEDNKVCINLISVKGTEPNETILKDEENWIDIDEDF